MWICAVTTAGMIFYGVRGLDTVNSRYVGFFYWSVPLLTFLVIAAGLTTALRSARTARLVAAGALLVALGAGLVSPALRADVHDNEPALVPAMAAVAARAHGRLIVLRTEDVQYDTHGLLVQAVRSGLRACVAGPPARIFAVTSEFICTPRQAATGALFWLYPLAARPVPGTHVIARLRYSVLAARARRRQAVELSSGDLRIRRESITVQLLVHRGPQALSFRMCLAHARQDARA